MSWVARYAVDGQGHATAQGVVHRACFEGDSEILQLLEEIHGREQV